MSVRVNKQLYLYDRTLMDYEMSKHVANLCRDVAKDVPPLNFTSAEVTSVPDKYIIFFSDVYDA